MNRSRSLFSADPLPRRLMLPSRAVMWNSDDWQSTSSLTQMVSDQFAAAIDEARWRWDRDHGA